MTSILPMAVIPAKAGVQLCGAQGSWTPAFAGMTQWGKRTKEVI